MLEETIPGDTGKGDHWRQMRSKKWREASRQAVHNLSSRPDKVMLRSLCFYLGGDERALEVEVWRNWRIMIKVKD